MNIAALNPGIERQVAPALEDIRDDHKERYLWARASLSSSEHVLDAGCGVGYGSALLAENAHTVHALDISPDAIEYARRYWARPNVVHEVADLCFFNLPSNTKCDAVIAFEVVEHLIEPRLFLHNAFNCLREGGRLFISVPNEKVIPHTVTLNPFHLRHYTTEEIRMILFECGFDVRTVASQNTKEIIGGDSGRFLILEAERRAKRPNSIDLGALTQEALTASAGFIVTRAMAIHKAVKDTKSLKAKLDESKKALSIEESTSELQVKLLQFFEGFHGKVNASTDLLVSDTMRRLRDLESAERDLHERLLHAEMVRVRAEENFKNAYEQGSELATKVEKLNRELTDTRTAFEQQRTELHQLLHEREIWLEKQSTFEANKKLQLEAEQALQQERQIADALRKQLNLQQSELTATLKQIEQERQRADELQQNLAQQLSKQTSLQQHDQEREALATQVATLTKQVGNADKRCKVAEVRLLAFGRDNELLVEANNELLQKLQQAETEISQLTRNTQALRAELQSLAVTTIKPPPTLGNIYKKLRFHRFYLPFLYKAVRNSFRNQVRHMRTKA